MPHSALAILLLDIDHQLSPSQGLAAFIGVSAAQRATSSLPHQLAGFCMGWPLHAPTLPLHVRSTWTAVGRVMTLTLTSQRLVRRETSLPRPALWTATKACKCRVYLQVRARHPAGGGWKRGTMPNTRSSLVMDSGYSSALDPAGWRLSEHHFDYG
jgi:hypothetical protein